MIVSKAFKVKCRHNNVFYIYNGLADNVSARKHRGRKNKKIGIESIRLVPDHERWYVHWHPSFLCHIRKKNLMHFLSD